MIYLNSVFSLIPVEVTEKNKIETPHLAKIFSFYQTH